jgi:hypothetical protein
LRLDCKGFVVPSKTAGTHSTSACCLLIIPDNKPKKIFADAQWDVTPGSKTIALRDWSCYLSRYPDAPRSGKDAAEMELSAIEHHKHTSQANAKNDVWSPNLPRAWSC